MLGQMTGTGTRAAGVVDDGVAILEAYELVYELFHSLKATSTPVAGSAVARAGQGHLPPRFAALKAMKSDTQTDPTTATHAEQLSSL